MNLTFSNGQVLSFTNITEEKRIHAENKVWELTIRSPEDLSSDELDALLTSENIGVMQYDNGTDVKTLTGYNSIDYVSKQIDTSGIALRIVLLKEDEENESQI